MTATPPDDGDSARCYICGGKGAVEDLDSDDGRTKPCPACGEDGDSDASDGRD